VAIPTKPVLQEPEHAEKPLRAANASNVRIVSTAPVWPGNVSPTDERYGMMKLRELNDHPTYTLCINVPDPFDAFNFLVVPP